MSKYFAIRKIRNGRVKINRHWYKPSEIHMKYDGRLDGLWYAFGLYHDYHSEDDIYAPYICLWGSKEAYDGMDTNFRGAEAVDGTLPWFWWNLEKIGNKKDD